ncbi:hypothetical protein [Conexibacter sp. SYSU D00693]|uniref:hypothetical protein n=1 Tax=Conexibacter sp. SYSU D00693 TaxID=2812560 RepID=UPI00196BAF68|nr:hypothetical protein [Conexibacter sp. SYSU D00693]
MRAAPVLACALLLVALAGCGGDELPTRAEACEGLRTATDPRALTVTGALDRYDRARLCREGGRPDAVTRVDGREVWTYGDTAFVLDEDGRTVDVRDAPR